MPKYQTQGRIIYDESGETVARAKDNKDAEKIACALTHYSLCISIFKTRLKLVRSELLPLKAKAVYHPDIYLNSPVYKDLIAQEATLIELITEMEKHT